YSCLSYCWGGDQPVKTTKITLHDHLSSISFFSLPRTLQDAIYVSDRLGIPMIWIDCLCIIQGDSDDLAVELARMPEIYKNAYVTISASSASTCYEGFLMSRNLAAIIQCPDLSLQYECAPGSVGNISLFQEVNTIEEDPIHKRAWTLQEKRISPRFLDFSTQQLQWICKSRVYSDGGYAPKFLDSSAREVALVPQGHEAICNAIFADWATVVDDYTKRTLSFPGDKLVAIAAMASETGSLLGPTYLAGLWHEHLAAQLLWRVWDDKKSARPEQYRAPSWSWASIDGWIMPEREFSEERVAIEIIDCTTTPVDARVPYGAIKSASLTVR
ncbi:heterokaryon incompatibility protein-domain-containing protein, partial [Clohesyomyces aquaticus]